MTHRRFQNKKRQKQKQIGGLLRINNDGTFFEAIIRMIISPDAKFTVITCKSLKGFIFKLTVREENAEFLGLQHHDDNTINMDKIITSYLFKFSLINDSSNKIRLSPLQKDDNTNDTYKKSTETSNSFFTELKYQNLIYIKTLPPLGKALCPSVIDFSIFDNSDESGGGIYLLNSSLQNTLGLEYDQIVFNYLKKELKDKINLQLGLIVMEYAENYIPAYTFINENLRDRIVSPRILDNYFNCNVIVKLLRMVLECKLFNFDCHRDNIMVNSSQYKDTTKSLETLDVLLIDFGRCVDLTGSFQEFLNNLKKLLCDDDTKPDSYKERYIRIGITNYYYKGNDPTKDNSFENIKNDFDNISSIILGSSLQINTDIKMKQNFIDILTFICRLDRLINSIYLKRYFNPQISKTIRFLLKNPDADINTTVSIESPSFEIVNSEYFNKILEIFKKETQLPVGILPTFPIDKVESFLNEGKLYVSPINIPIKTISKLQEDGLLPIEPIDRFSSLVGVPIGESIIKCIEGLCMNFFPTNPTKRIKTSGGTFNYKNKTKRKISKRKTRVKSRIRK